MKLPPITRNLAQQVFDLKYREKKDWLEINSCFGYERSRQGWHYIFQKYGIKLTRKHRRDKLVLDTVGA